MSREKFEAWWEINYHNGKPPRFGWAAWRDGDGYKIDDDESELDGMWNAWQAATNAMEAKCAALAAELKQSQIDAGCYKHGMESSNARLAQVAADNAALKSFGGKLADMHNDLNGEGTGIQGRAEVACQQVALEAAMEEFDAIKTPATDAFLAEARAQGVESAINTVIAIMNHQHPVTSKAIDILRVNAAQLRKGAAL